MLRQNPNGDFPQVDESAFIDDTAIIVGDVKIGKNVFVGPYSVIRADEPGSSVIISDNCNVQDRVIFHAHGGSSVTLAERVSLAHGCIVHGPCSIGEKTFIGFGSVVYNANVGSGVFLKHLVTVENTTIPDNKIINSSQLVNSSEIADALPEKSTEEKELISKIVQANLKLVRGYNKIQNSES